MFGASADLPRIIEIDLAQIQFNPDQPRKYFDEESIAELAASIEVQGLLQPILVKRGAAESYIIVAGERRVRAHLKLKRLTIAAIVTEGDSEEIALIENIQRENLRPIEEAEALARLIESHGYTHEDVARVVGKARNTVSELLSILKLPEAIKSECRTSDIASKSVLIELGKMRADVQSQAWQELKTGYRTVQIARATKGGHNTANSAFDKVYRAMKICTKALHGAENKVTRIEMKTLLEAKIELDLAFRKLRSNR